MVCSYLFATVIESVTDYEEFLSATNVSYPTAALL